MDDQAGLLDVSAADARDHDLLAHYVRENSQPAFARLVQRHIGLVYAAARRQVGGDPHLAEDVTQAVFLLLANKARARQIPSGTILAGWLFNATRYAAANAKKSEARRKHHERQGGLMSCHPTAGDVCDAPWDTVAPLLDGALARLASADRDAVLLKFIQGKSHRDVGVAMGISEEAARKRVSRAIDRLRQLLTRRGVALSAVTLGALLTSHAAEAAPPALTAACGFAASGATTSTVIGKGTLGFMTFTKAKLGAACVAAAMVVGGGTGYAMHIIKARQAARAPVILAQAPAQATPKAPAAASTGAPPAVEVKLIEGTVVRGDGEPLPDVEVYLATPQNSVNIYSRNQRNKPQITEPDGKFSFVRPPDDNWKIVAMTPEGVAQVLAEDLAKSPLVVLQPWGRVEGTLYAATKPLAGQTVHLGEWGWAGDALDNCVTNQTTVKTDKDGHFVADRVTPGSPMFSHQQMTSWGHSSKWECIRVDPGKTVKVELGTAGRPVLGRVVVPPGWEKKVPLRSDKVHSWDLGARMMPPTDKMNDPAYQYLHGMPASPNWERMTPRQQNLYRHKWEDSPMGIAHRKVMFADQTDLKDGGTFRFDVLRPGHYALNVRSLELIPEQSILEDVAGANFEFTVPEMPAGTKATEEPLDIGAVQLVPQPRIVKGDAVPAFDLRTPDGKPVKLADYKGKFLVLQVQWAHLPRDTWPGLKKAYEAFGKDPQFAMLTVLLDSGFAPATAKPGAWEGLSWPVAVASRGALGQFAGFDEGYSRGPASIFIIGPDGVLLTKLFQGDKVETALAQVMLERK
ncbi:MAG TPA: sigma-70 family RNA polymerase sigma factor [Tepidisphaeraceae bacterium]|jgi:RNA polymerase sigma factor (sigma-70 family)